MAKRNATSRTRKNTTPAKAEEPKVSKAQAIRDYKTAHPDHGPKEIAEALTKKGIEVNAGRVSAVLRTGTSRGRVDAETVKLAADFVGQYDGSISDAVAAIETVGGIVEQCNEAKRQFTLSKSKRPATSST